MTVGRPEINCSEEIVRDARSSLDDFLAKRTVIFPTIRQRMAQGGGTRAKLLRPLLYVALNRRGIKNKKYVLFSARFPELAAQFTRDEAVLVGGPAELRVAMKLKLPFRFSGDLYAATPDLMFGPNEAGSPRPALRVVGRWQEFFRRQAGDCCLVTPTDTLPIGLLLSKIVARQHGARVVCVQHGLFNSGYNADDIDGRNSHINLVYSEGQSREMLRRLPGALVEVMGFPGEVLPVSCVRNKSRIAVLVGTGALEHINVYKKSIAIYRDLGGMMAACGYQVIYRPHPTERAEHYGRTGLIIDSRPKSELLGGEAKVFFGFTSTLLYEADLAGHLVVTLDDPLLPGYSIEPIGVMLATTKLREIVAVVQNGWQKLQRRPPTGVIPLRERFIGALERATLRLNVHRSAFQDQRPSPTE